MVTQVDMWQQRVTGIASTIETGMKKTHEDMAAQIATTVTDIATETTKAHKQIKKYAVTSARDIREIRDSLDELITRDDADHAIIKRASDMLEEYADKVDELVPVVNKHRETIQNMTTAIHRFGASVANDKKGLDFYIQKLAEIGAKVGVDVGEPPESWKSDAGPPSGTIVGSEAVVVGDRRAPLLSGSVEAPGEGMEQD